MEALFSDSILYWQNEKFLFLSGVIFFAMIWLQFLSAIGNQGVLLLYQF